MRRQLTTLAGGLACIALTGVILFTGARTIQNRESTVTPSFSLETPDSDDLALPEDDSSELPFAEPEPDSQTVMPVTPEASGLPAVVTQQPLERVAPRQPLSDPVGNDDETRQATVLRHPVALSAGEIRFGDRTVQLAGILPQQGDRTCSDQGKLWPCGMVARTAFRNYIRARALVCEVPAKAWRGTLTSACTLNGIDPAIWLVENGWADVEDGQPLAAKAAHAREAGLGFHGPDPRMPEAAPPAPAFEEDPFVVAPDIGEPGIPPGEAAPTGIQ